jgi:hypothetical protein
MISNCHSLHLEEGGGGQHPMFYGHTVREDGKKDGKTFFLKKAILVQEASGFLGPFIITGINHFSLHDGLDLGNISNITVNK